MNSHAHADKHDKHIAHEDKKHVVDSKTHTDKFEIDNHVDNHTPMPLPTRQAAINDPLVNDRLVAHAGEPALHNSAAKAAVVDHHLAGDQRLAGAHTATLATQQVKDVKEHGTWSNVAEHDHTTLYVDKERHDDIHRKDLHKHDAHATALHDDHLRARDPQALPHDQAGFAKKNPPAI